MVSVSYFISLMAVLSLNFSSFTKWSALLLLDSDMTEREVLPSLGFVCSSLKCGCDWLCIDLVGICFT